MAKRDVSAIVSGAGLVAGVWTDLVAAVRECGGTDEDVHRLATPAGRAIIRKIAQIIVGEQPRDIFSVTVDYSITLAGMINFGRYDYGDPDITADNFSVKGKGQVEVGIELVHFNRDIISLEEALDELDRMGLRSAKIEELLAFGTKYPDKQREFMIIALGSVWRPRADRSRYGYVACIWGDHTKRRLNRLWCGSGWANLCRFAAVRK